MMLFVPRTVHFCYAGDHCVFLNVKDNRYVCLEEPEIRYLQDLVFDWPHPNFGQQQLPGSATDRDRNDFIKAMYERGLLTDRAAESKAPRITEIELPTSSLYSPASSVKRVPTYSDIRWFYKSCCSAFSDIWFERFEEALAKVVNRRPPQFTKIEQPNLEQVRLHVTEFYTLRPYFPPKGECLFELFALATYLSRFAIFPTLVFGVRTEPFFAHCWLQIGKQTLAGSAEYNSKYTPIAAI